MTESWAWLNRICQEGGMRDSLGEALEMEE